MSSRLSFHIRHAFVDLEAEEARYLYIVFCIALFARLTFVFFISTHIPPAPDTKWFYDPIATNLLAGNGFAIRPGEPTSIREPLYPFFLAVVYFLLPHSHLAVTILQSVFGALTCVFLFYIARIIFNSRVAYLSSFICALYPPLIYQTCLVINDNLFTLILSLCVLSMVKVFAIPSTRYSVICGALLGMASLTRGIILSFPILLLIGLVIINKHRRSLALYQFVVISISMVIVIIPWSVRNYRVQGAFIPIAVRSGEVLYCATFEHLLNTKRDERIPLWLEAISKVEIPARVTQGQRDKILFQAGIKRIVERPLTFVRLCLRRFLQFWYRTDSGVYDVYVMPLQFGLLLSGILGMVFSRGLWRASMPLVLIIIYFTGIHTVLCGYLRYSLPIMPFTMIFAAYFLTDVCYPRLSCRLRTVDNK